LDIKPWERRVNCLSLPEDNLEETRNEKEFSTLVTFKFGHCMDGAVLGKHL